jgi:hypothetical protein
MLNKFNPSIKKLLSQHGEKKIESITIYRKPIQSIINTVLNTLSLGQFNKNLKESNYDKLFHLYMIVTLSYDEWFIIEKNERINIKKINTIDNKIENRVVNINKPLTINEMLNNTINNIGPDNFYIYRSHSWNCQNFIMNILNSNNLLSNDLKEFIIQDTEKIFNKLGYLKKISDVVTDTAAKTDMLIRGGKIKNKKKKISNYNNIMSEKKYHKIYKINIILPNELINENTNKLINPLTKSGNIKKVNKKKVVNILTQEIEEPEIEVFEQIAQEVKQKKQKKKDDKIVEKPVEKIEKVRRSRSIRNKEMINKMINNIIDDIGNKQDDKKNKIILPPNIEKLMSNVPKLADPQKIKKKEIKKISNLTEYEQKERNDVLKGMRTYGYRTIEGKRAGATLHNQLNKDKDLKIPLKKYIELFDEIVLEDQF